ncbi:Hint domain-containing protein [Algirhabdus cladophorae]|uniref:Hint domain-containing protein n=1 Tax=Algirhabdus cladophorae TaxID=3377108 RepID=UPI003B849C5A
MAAEDYETGTALIDDFISTGVLPSDAEIRNAAAGLSSDYVITFGYAGEAGVAGTPFGVEGTRTWVYDSNGERFGMSSLAGTLGVGAFPVEGAVEIGIAYVGDEGVSSLTGFSITLEGGVGVGAGITVPLNGGGAEYAAGVFSQLNGGSISDLTAALQDLPPGTILFAQAGMIAGGGGEVSYTISDSGLSLFFGDANYQGPASFDGVNYSAALRYVEGRHGPVTIQWTFEGENGETLTIRQQFQAINQRDGVMSVNMRTKIFDEDGNQLNESEVREYGFTNRTQVIGVQNGGFVELQRCFAAGSLIEMWDGPQKTIEDVAVDDIVMSYTNTGELVPGRVTKLFSKETTIVLDFHGLHVTPEHVFLCAHGVFDGTHVPLIDILRSDAAVVTQSGQKIRAATGLPVGSEGDQRVLCVVTGETTKTGQTRITNSTKLRLDTRFIHPNGVDMSLAELVEGLGKHITEDGLISPDETGTDAQPLYWSFSEKLPLPEDYVLSRSGVSLDQILACEFQPNMRQTLQVAPPLS